MKKKLIGIFVCMLLIATAIPAVGIMNIKQSLTCDANGPYEGNIMEDIEFDGTATGGIPPYEYFWNYGDGNTSSGDPHPTHNYANAGNYTVTLTVTDSENNTANDTTWAWINTPPNAPDIEGPTVKPVPSPLPKQGEPINYTFKSKDPDGDNVSYYIEWDDGSYEDWFGPYESGEEVVVNHTWSEKKVFKIRAKAKDTYGAESNWGTLEVTIPKNKQVSNMWFLRFLESHPHLFLMLRYLFGL